MGKTRKAVFFSNSASRMRNAVLIILYQAPPMWEEWGVLNDHVQPCSCKYPLNSGSSILMFSSRQAPIKFVPLLDLKCLTSPRTAKNCLRALMKLEVDMTQWLPDGQPLYFSRRRWQPIFCCQHIPLWYGVTLCSMAQTYLGPREWMVDLLSLYP